MDETTYVHRIQCAASSRGCMSSLVIESRTKDLDEKGRRLLNLNGWWLDHGRWVCGNHERPAENPPR